jgi:hypothetical protein
MISNALVFLRNRLNTYVSSGQNLDDSQEDRVVFIDGQNMEPLSFKLGAISVLLINLEEENTLRAPDRYHRLSAEGTQQKINPEIRLNLYVLFVARFKQYEDSLHYLSLVIRYFQHNRLIQASTAPDLDARIERLVIELVTLPLSQQNEVWSALRAPYHPSALYKVKMVIFQDEEATPLPKVEAIDIRVTS